MLEAERYMLRGWRSKTAQKIRRSACQQHPTESECQRADADDHDEAREQVTQAAGVGRVFAITLERPGRDE
jgi:hypothetical protein